MNKLGDAIGKICEKLLPISEEFYIGNPSSSICICTLSSVKLLKEIKNSNFNNFYTNMSQDVFMRFDDGPFEDLKSSGLDVISNDSLRTVINNTYTVKLPLFQHLANRLNDESKPEISKLESKFLKLIPVLHDDGRKHLHFDLKIDDILNNQDFLLVLYNQQKKYDEYKFQLKEIRTTLNQLKTDIEKELEK